MTPQQQQQPQQQEEEETAEDQVEESQTTESQQTEDDPSELLFEEEEEEDDDDFHSCAEDFSPIESSRVDASLRAKAKWDPVVLQPTTQAPRQHKFPKKDTKEHKKLTELVEAMDLPNFSADDTTQEMEAKMLDLTSTAVGFLESLSRVKSPPAIESMVLEFGTLSELKRTLVEGYDEISALVEQATALSKLKYTKSLFPEGVVDCAKLVEARRVLGKLYTKEKRRANYKASRRAVPNLTKLYFEDPKKCWETINALENVKCQVPAKDIVDHFSSVLRGAGNAEVPYEFDLSPITSIPAVAATQPRACTQEEDEGQPFTLAEVEKAIKHANKQSAPGHDGLPIKVFALGGKPWAEMLTQLFEILRTRGEVLEYWRLAIIALLYKKGD
jgi:hypothetical protein